MNTGDGFKIGIAQVHDADVFLVDDACDFAEQFARCAIWFAPGCGPPPLAAGVLRGCVGWGRFGSRRHAWDSTASPQPFSLHRAKTDDASETLQIAGE